MVPRFHPQCSCIHRRARDAARAGEAAQALDEWLTVQFGVLSPARQGKLPAAPGVPRCPGASLPRAYTAHWLFFAQLHFTSAHNFLRKILFVFLATFNAGFAAISYLSVGESMLVDVLPALW